MQRISLVSSHICPNSTANKRDVLAITDNRTGKTYEVPVKNDYISASDLLKIKSVQGDVLRSYDPGYMNTINCTSAISYIDGDKGILTYRGYPIEQLAEKSNFLEVAFLLIYGELPTTPDFLKWQKKIMTHTFIHADVGNMMRNFRYDAHPMGMLVSTIAAVSTLHPEANPALVGSSIYNDRKMRNKQIHRLLGNIPTLATNAYRHRIGRAYNKPQKDLGYTENFLYMLDRLNENKYKPNPKIVRAIDILFILHAEHELNCSTSAVRHLASSGVDVYTSIACAAGALYGPLHGGANEAVLRMLESIGSKENIPKFIEDVKNKKQLLFGFGHRVYKNYDPRAKIVRTLAEDVFEIVGKESLIEIAIELEKIALNDEYFIKRKLYPNVDFYTGVIYRALGFPTDMFPVLFTIPRVSGWIAHWNEFLDDPENKIVRPRQNYQGSGARNYIPIADRKINNFFLESTQSAKSKRREAAVTKQ